MLAGVSNITFAPVFWICAGLCAGNASAFKPKKNNRRYHTKAGIYPIFRNGAYMDNEFYAKNIPYTRT